MLKTPTNYKFKEFVDSVNLKSAYRIAIDDEISIQMYSNDGYNFISLTGGGGNNTNQNRGRGANSGNPSTNGENGNSGMFF